MSRKEAARELQISMSTLRTHFDRALHKAHAEDVIPLFWRIVIERDRLRAEGSIGGATRDRSGR